MKPMVDWGAVRDRQASEALLIDVDGYEGPLDLLLTLARTQKVDLRRKISVLSTGRAVSGLRRSRPANRCGSSWRRITW